MVLGCGPWLHTRYQCCVPVYLDSVVEVVGVVKVVEVIRVTGVVCASEWKILPEFDFFLERHIFY